MAQLLIRDLNESTVKRLKTMARRHGRSVQGEVKLLVEEAVASNARREQFWSRAEKIREKLAATGREFPDSAELIREDRDR